MYVLYEVCEVYRVHELYEVCGLYEVCKVYQEYNRRKERHYFMNNLSGWCKLKSRY